MARTNSFNNTKSIVNALNTLNETSYFLKRQLVHKGYLTVNKMRTSDKAGRYAHVYEVSGKGRGLLAISENWKKKQSTEDNIIFSETKNVV